MTKLILVLGYSQWVATNSPAQPAGASLSGQVNATQETLRESNLALVARTIFASINGISRAGVSAEVGLTRATVSRLVEDLLSGGLVREEGQVSGGPGRPATRLVPASTLCALGMQVNATYRICRLMGLDGYIVDEIHVPGEMVDSDPREVLSALGNDARELLARSLAGRRLVGAGLALPGIVSEREGLLRRAPNLGWTDAHPASLMGLEDLVQLEVLGNEADLAAFSLARPAPGRTSGPSSFIYVSGEIGIGGSAVIEGEVMRGLHGWAGELGHMCVDPRGPSCPCGSHGCLERYAGWRAFEVGAGLPHGSDVDDFLARHRDGDQRAEATLAAAAEALETALVSVVNLLDIPTIVIGGHLAELGAIILPGVEEGVRRRALSGRFDGLTVTIWPAATADDPGRAAAGAAAAVLDEVVKHPASWLGR